VGQKIDLEYNIETMRITDEGGENGDPGSGFARRPSTSLMDSIKAKSQVKSEDDSDKSVQPTWERATGTPAWEQGSKISADVQSAKLKQLLGKIKSV
jgi:hypothetical protein